MEQQLQKQYPWYDKIKDAQKLKLKKVLDEKPKWDEISVEDLQDLVDKVEKFYEERGNPKMNVVWLADAIIRRLKNDADYWVNCEGFKGKGKSNLILLLALLMSRYSGIWINKSTGELAKVYPRTKPLGDDWEHLRSGFSFSQNMSFLDSHINVKNKYNNLDRYMPFIIDEGSKNLHKQNWQSKTQFLLVQMSDTERYQNKCCFVCFPNFKELNSVFRNDRISMRLYIYYRSTAKKFSSCIISLKDENRHIYDPWHTDENAKTYENLLKKIPLGARSPQSVLSAEKKLRGYIGNFDVPSLKHIAPKIWKIYMTYKIDNAQKELNEVDEKEMEFEKKLHKWKFGVYNLISYIKERFPDATVKELSTVCNLSASQINSLKDEMRRKTQVAVEDQ